MGNNNKASKAIIGIMSQESLRAEYESADRVNNHLDLLNWQVGSILIGGTLAATALSTSRTGLEPIFFAGGAIFAVLSWFLFVRRNRGIAQVARLRAGLIENELGGTLELHKRISEATKKGCTKVGEEFVSVPGPSGYDIVKILTTATIIALLSLIVYRFLQYIALVK